MGIRLKLFVPMLLLILAISLMIHFYWLPNYLKDEREKFIVNETHYIGLLSTALIPGLLTNDISQIHATLRRVLKARTHWYTIRLYNAGNVRLFPLTEKKLPDNNTLKKFEHQVTYEGRDIASMEFWIDINRLLQEDADNIKKLEAILLGLLLVISTSATLLQDRWIRKPLRQLLDFAQQLTHGHYDASLDYQSGDEFGELVASLKNMRDKVNEREKELQAAHADLSKANSLLEHQSNTDALTTIYNRRYFDEMLSKEISRNSRLNTPIALILCDVDYFKQFNDTYGHQEGDYCLRQVALTLQRSFTRSEDVVTRYGGEEFGIILPNTDREQAIEMAVEMQSQVSALKIPHKSSGVADHVTISVGVGVIRPDKDTIMSTLIEEADKALYQAKNDGRNLIRVSVF
jgi:diguanylate cyclase (GGDEF)-like protein